MTNAEKIELIEKARLASLYILKLKSPCEYCELIKEHGYKNCPKIQKNECEHFTSYVELVVPGRRLANEVYETLYSDFYDE